MTATSWCSALPSRRTLRRSPSGSVGSACQGRGDDVAPPRCRATPRSRNAQDRGTRWSDATALVAHGFCASMLVDLVNQGLATLTSSKVRADGKMIEVGRVRIKAAGRRAIEEGG